MSFENLVVELSGDESPLLKSSKAAAGALGRLGRDVGRLAAGAGVAGGVLVAGVAAGATALGVQASESIDATRKLATNLNVSTSEAQAYTHALDLMGVKAEDGHKALQRMTRELADSALTTKTTKRAMQSLGLDLAGLQGKAPIEQFEIVTRALGQMENAGERAQVAAQLFGRQWQKLGVAIEDGGHTLAASKELFIGLGLGLGDAGAEVERMNDSFSTLVAIGAALRDKVFAALAPKLEQLAGAAEQFVIQLIQGAGGADKLTEIITGNLIQGLRTLGTWLGDIGRVAEVVMSVFTALGEILAWLGKLGNVYGGVIAGLVQIAQGNFSGALAIGRDLFANDDDGTEKTNEELRRQTDMLAKIAKNSFAAVLG